jgi:hypothetical protein
MYKSKLLLRKYKYNFIKIEKEDNDLMKFSNIKIKHYNHNEDNGGEKKYQVNFDIFIGHIMFNQFLHSRKEPS